VAGNGSVDSALGLCLHHQIPGPAAAGLNVTSIEKGELVLPYKLAAEDGGSVPSSLIPTGMRTVSVNVNEVTGVAGFVAPGTRVGVLATVNFSGSNEPRNVTILQTVN